MAKRGGPHLNIPLEDEESKVPEFMRIKLKAVPGGSPAYKDLSPKSKIGV